MLRQLTRANQFRAPRIQRRAERLSPGRVVVNLMNWAYETLLPGGTLIVGNVVPSNPTKAYMDHILEWVLLHRSAEDLRELFSRSRFGATPVRLQVESAGVDLFAFCRKA